MIKKLIEVALPLEIINAESAREKSIRHGHPSTLHLWWARRPLAATRAVIWSSLVDDPSSHPELFPTEEEQNKERQRLFNILGELVVWENSNNQDVLNAAKAEITKYTNGEPPALLDPFAGGGAIPLEAQRLGLDVHAHDLNPVAVMINRAMIEIPARFENQNAVNPDDIVSKQKDSWIGFEGIASDINYYGTLLKNTVYKELKNNYPKINLPGSRNDSGSEVVAWIWARTVKCPNPACKCKAPLMKSNVLLKSKAFIDIQANNNVITYSVKQGSPSHEVSTVTRKGAVCICCGNPIPFTYIREEGKQGRLGNEMVAIVAKGKKGRVYLSATQEQKTASKVSLPDISLGELAFYPGYLNPPAYGFETIESLFTKRQLLMLNIFSERLPLICKIIERDSVSAGLKNDHIPLRQNGTGAKAYAEAIITYLAFAIDKLSDYNSSICSWNPSREGLRNTFGLTGMSMSWDYAEANPFSGASGCFDNMIEWITKAICNLPKGKSGKSRQIDARIKSGLNNVIISTDPPYYNNVPYADFSDFFYVWMRKNLNNIYPDLFGTMQTPKSDELVADPYRSGGKEKAASFFEAGMLEACKEIYKSSGDYPVSIYYAYKQSEESQEGNLKSTGWETMLSAIINAGFVINGTWPIRTEKPGRTRGNGANALASSIVLVCRKRPLEYSQVTRRNLINILRRELRPALKRLQESNIAPVDLAQSAIGPGMGVFSRYQKVLEADGTPMTVRSALQVINEEIDLYFNEQVGDLDAMSRFCVELYTQSAFTDIKFGDADILARAKGTSVATLASHDVVYAKSGTVHLIQRTDLPEKIDNNESCIWLLTQQLTRAMETGGIEACAKAIIMMFGSNAEKAKDLAYRLYTIAEQKKWANEAFAYNALVVAWPEIQSRAAMMQRETPEQMSLFSMGLLDT